MDVQDCLDDLGHRTLPNGQEWQDTTEFRVDLIDGVDSLCRAQQGKDLVSVFQRASNSGSSADVKQVLSEPLRITFMSGEHIDGTFTAGYSAATVMELVADYMNDNDPHACIDASQVRVCADAQVLKPTDALPEDIEGVVGVTFVAQTWRHKADELPAQIRDIIYMLSEKDDSDDRTWGDCGEFVQIVDALAKLCEKEPRRGGISDLESEFDEILEVLKEAAARPDACPSSVLKELVNEFGGFIAA